MALLSVHLITYNNELHIEETLQSILNQKVTFDYEIVIGDDCSTDSTLSIINTYTEKHPNLIKVHKNDTTIGILKNFIATLDRCSGTYVLDIAGDDILNGVNALQKIVDVFIKNPEIGFIDSGFDDFIEKTNTIIPYKNKHALNSSKELYKDMALLGKIAPIGLAYNRELLHKHVDFKNYLKMGVSIEDYPIIVDLILNTEFKRIKESLHIYRVHEKSYSHNQNLTSLIAQKEQMKYLFDYFSKKYGFEKSLINTFNEDHEKETLFLAGYFSDKDLGKKAYKRIQKKSIKDIIHYLASQNTALRNLITLRKKLLIHK